MSRIHWPPNAPDTPLGTPRSHASGLSTPGSANISLHSDADDDERYRMPSKRVYGRRRSTIVPETLFGDPGGTGPLRIGAFFRATKPEHELMSWSVILEIVTRGDLELLLRHPDCEKEYMTWAKSIKKHYGGLEQYIARERIGWQPANRSSGDKSANAEDEEVQSTFFDDEAAKAAERENSSVVRIVFNDWPYAVPLDCQHYVVWSRFPIIDLGLFESPDTPFPKGPLLDAVYAGIMADGIRGATGAGSDIVPIGDRTSRIIRDALQGKDAAEALAAAAPTLENDAGADQSAASIDNTVFIIAKTAHHWAARFVNRFIEQHWQVEDYETAWFCNPPHLRTVPGLSHFHVIVRPKPQPPQESLLFSPT